MAQSKKATDLAKTDTPAKVSLKDVRVWVNENMPKVLAFHDLTSNLKKSRETATCESAVRGIGQDMERLLGALDKISSVTGKKEVKATAFPSPRG